MQARNIPSAEITPLAYRNDALLQLTTLLRIPPTRIAKIFNHTNNISINRWLEGNNIYTHSLLGLCNLLKLDLLSFFTYNGKTFQTNFGDIVRMEEAGLNLRDFLTEHGVTPCDFNESRTLSQQTPHEPFAIEDPSHPLYKPIPPAIGTSDTPKFPSEILDYIIKLQCNATEHERVALEQQREDLNAIIDEKERQISKLGKELKQAQEMLKKANNS